MLLAHVDDAFKNMLLLYWCGPYECVALIQASKLWSCGTFLRGAAFFALSRMHAPGYTSCFAMNYWYSVWKQCKQVFLAKGWPATLWRHSCRFQLGGATFVPHEPFFKAVNDMIGTRIDDDPVASVLATSIEVGNVGLHSLNALVLLKSGAFAFVGSLNSEDNDLLETDLYDMFVNVVAASSLQGVAAQASGFVATHMSRCEYVLNHCNYAEEMPWYVEDHHSHGDIAHKEHFTSFPRLVIYFCDQGMLGGSSDIVIRDALLPSEDDEELAWDGAFTRAYLYSCSKSWKGTFLAMRESTTAQ